MADLVWKNPAAGQIRVCTARSPVIPRLAA
jgi:hypothetical protein